LRFNRSWIAPLHYTTLGDLENGHFVLLIYDHGAQGADTNTRTVELFDPLFDQQRLSTSTKIAHDFLGRLRRYTPNTFSMPVIQVDAKLPTDSQTDNACGFFVITWMINFALNGIKPRDANFPDMREGAYFPHVKVARLIETLVSKNNLRHNRIKVYEDIFDLFSEAGNDEDRKRSIHDIIETISNKAREFYEDQQRQRQRDL
jgi:hypothetical protein